MAQLGFLHRELEKGATRDLTSVSPSGEPQFTQTGPITSAVYRQTLPGVRSGSPNDIFGQGPDADLADIDKKNSRIAARAVKQAEKTSNKGILAAFLLNASAIFDDALGWMRRHRLRLKSDQEKLARDKADEDARRRADEDKREERRRASEDDATRTRTSQNDDLHSGSSADRQASTSPSRDVGREPALDERVAVRPGEVPRATAAIDVVGDRAAAGEILGADRDAALAVRSVMSLKMPRLPFGGVGAVVEGTAYFTAAYEVIKAGFLTAVYASSTSNPDPDVGAGVFLNSIKSDATAFLNYMAPTEATKKMWADGSYVSAAVEYSNVKQLRKDIKAAGGVIKYAKSVGNGLIFAFGTMLGDAERFSQNENEQRDVGTGLAAAVQQGTAFAAASNTTTRPAAVTVADGDAAHQTAANLAIKVSAPAQLVAQPQ